MRNLIIVIAAIFAVACTPRPAPTESSSGTMDVPGSESNLQNKVVDGPLPGCADAFELVGQTLTLNKLQVTLDAEGIIDRVGVVTTGAKYKFSTRPVNPVNCRPSRLPVLEMPEVTFGFNYLGDFTRNNPLCINGSSIEFTSFEITGTPIDKVVEKSAKDTVWEQVDLEVAKILQPLLIGGSFPAAGRYRCSNWIDLSTL